MTLDEPRTALLPAHPEAAAAPAGQTLGWSQGTLMRHGRPTRVLSGSLHYFRVLPQQWRDRVRRLRDLGLDTVDTYVPWNFHQPRRDGPAAFDGPRDLESFLSVVHEEGMAAVLRPSPYVCAEWYNGGLPFWLTARGEPLRSSHPGFLDAVARWWDQLLPRLVPFEAVDGGPVLAWQVENEFGSFGDDRCYLEWLVAAMRARGLRELTFTADGPVDVMQDGGSVDGQLAAVTLGSRPEQARELLAARRPGEPFVCAEFWNGWFDHWGHPHHVRDADNAAAALAGIVRDGGSVSLYMAHGGTNFGLWSGANDVDGELRPTVTSYDSDAPVAEDGTLTTKFHAMRRVLGADAPVLSPAPRFLPAQRLEVRRGALLGQVLARSAVDHGGRYATCTSEQLGVDAVLTRFTADVVLPDRDVVLALTRVADRAQVLVDGAPVGTVTGAGEVTVRGRGRPARVELLVENLGRINYGHRLGEPKGLLGPVLVERRAVQTWAPATLDLAAARADDLAAWAGPPAPGAHGAGVVTAELVAGEPLDTHLALPGFGKGFVWVGDFLLGRYWEIGPQRTLYLPGPLLRPGTTVLTVLELERVGTHLELRTAPDLGPREPYVEEF